MLSVVVFLPLAAAPALLAIPRLADRRLRWAGVAVTAADLALVVGLWVAHRAGGPIAFEQRATWIPTIGVGYHVGAAIDSGQTWLAIVAIVNAVASVFYYLRWLAPSFLRPPAQATGALAHAGAWTRGSGSRPCDALGPRVRSSRRSQDDRLVGS